MPLITSTIVSLSAFFIFFGTHALVWRRLSVQKKGLFLLLKIAVFSYALVLGLVLFTSFFSTLTFERHLLSLSLYLLLIMLYLHLYVGMERSLSVRILSELAQSKKNALTTYDIQTHYSPQLMFKKRIEGLTFHEYLNEKSGVYRCTRKGIFLARITCALQKIYGLTHTG